MRKIFSGIFIVLSVVLLGVSLAGIALVWQYNALLIEVSSNRLQVLDNELTQAHTAIKNAKLELERTQRLIAAAETSLASLKTEFVQAKKVFDSMDGSLKNQLIPGMVSFRTNLDQAKTGMGQLLVAMKKLNSLPYMGSNITGDQLLVDLIASTDSINAQILSVEGLANKSSVFINDASYVLGADFSETNDNLSNFLIVVTEYDQKFNGWQAQLDAIQQQLPGWIRIAAIGLMIFLLWFSFSQFGMIVHGLNLWHVGGLSAGSGGLRVDEPQV